MKRFCIAFFALLCYFTNTWADSDSIFVVSNITYKKVDKNAVFVCPNYSGNKYIQTCSDSTLNIPSSVVYEGKNYKVRGIERGAFFVNSSIKHVRIGKGVEEIQDHAFNGCASIEDIFIPSSVSTIGEDVLSFCPNLSSIKVDKDNPYFDSREECNAIISKRDNKLLYGCGNTKIPSSVEIIGEYAFYGCTMENVQIPEGVGIIEKKAFCNCSFLKQISISSTVEWIEGASFSKCCNISSISVDDRNEIYNSGNNCNAVIEKDANKLVFGCCNTVIPSYVTEIGESAFSYSANIHSLDIPEGVTTIHDAAFYKCVALKHISLPSTLKCFEGQTHFCDCVSLDSIFIPKNVELIPGDLFKGCMFLQSIKVDSRNSVYDSRNNCNAVIRKIDNELVAGCKASVIVEGVKSIGENAFLKSGITSIHIPASVERIDSMAFRDCKYCKTITRHPQQIF